MAEFLGNEGGLNSSEIYTIYQDKDGFIWVGNKPGVSRFDGYDFKNFTRADTLYLGQIYAIEEDSRGTLWIGGTKGLFFYQDGVFHAITSINYAIRDLHLDQRNKLWVGGFGFIPFALTDNELTTIKTGGVINIQPIVSEAEWKEKIGSLQVWSMDTDRNNHLWLGLYNCKASFDGEQLYIHWKNSTVRHMYEVVAAFHQDSVFWGCEETYTQFQKNGQFETPVELNNLTHEIAVTDTACYFLTNGHIVKLQAGHWTQLFAFDDKIDFYFHNMLLDREGNFWIGGDGNLLKLTPTYFKNMTETDYPLLEYNFNIAELPNEAILISGASGKVKKIERQNVEPYRYLDVPNTSEVRAIFVDENDWIWYGTSMSGIILERNGIEENYNTKEGLGDKGQYFFYKTKKGELWSGGVGLINRINVSADGQLSFDNFKLTAASSDLPLFQSMFESPNGAVWGASDKGLFTLEEGQLTQWSFPPPVNPQPIVTGAKIDRHQQLWLSIQGEGVWQCRFNEKNEPVLVRQWTTEDGLLTDFILNVHIDKEDNIWTVSQAGICRLNWMNKTPDIRCFNETDGWLNTATSRYELLESQNGHLWAVGLESINILPLYNLPKNRVKPQSFITNVELLDDKENIFQYAKNEKKSNQLPQQLILPHDKNALRVYFTATSHTKPKKNKFKYALEGLDDNWYAADDSRTVLYTSLPAGTYTFKVLAANNDGIWGSTASTFTFKISPPWWMTWWAYLLYVLIIGGIVVMFYRFQLSRKLAVQESQRLQEINQLKTSLYTNITHEFRTPLTVILGMTKNLQIQSTSNDWKPAHQPLKMIYRSGEKLLQLVNEMLDLAKIESGNMTLDLQQADIIPFIKYVVESFHSLAGEKDIRLTIHSNKEALWMDFDAYKLASIISNLLSNAIKFTPEAGEVTVHLEHQSLGGKEYLFIYVKDNGKGLSLEEAAHVFDRFYQAGPSTARKEEGTGIGLALTKELVQLMNGSIEVQSEAVEGSEFIVQLPVHRNKPLTEQPISVVASAKATATLEQTATEELTDDSTDLPLVLIIEDNLDVAHYIGTCLKGQYRYAYAVNGKIGIEMALEQIPDLIISDVMMPEKDGFEVCAALKTDERTNHIPIILLTAKATVQDRLTGLGQGADAYLAKPFEKEELWIRLHQLLALRKTLQQKYSEHFLAEEASVQKEDPFVTKAKIIVLAELGNEDFSPHELSQQLFLSPSQVYRKLKALTGMSTSIFIRNVRLQEAKKLLATTDFSIAEISYQVGFKTPLYFSQIFKETFGKSPSTLRK